MPLDSRLSSRRGSCQIEGMVSYNQPLGDASLIACPDCDLLQRLPELAPGASARCPRCDKELWRRREDSLNRTLALATRGRGSLRGRELRADARPDRRRARGLHHGRRRRAAALARRPRDRRRAGALHRGRRAGAADRLHARDRARGPAPAPAGSGSATLLRHHPTASHLEHDRGDDARRAGRAHQDRRLRDGDPGAGAVRARRADLPARRDPGELRPPGGVGPGRVGGDGSATRDVAWAQ